MDCGDSDFDIDIEEAGFSLDLGSLLQHFGQADESQFAHGKH